MRFFQEQRESEKYIYVAPLQYHRSDGTAIVKGLFVSIPMKPGDYICRFIGERVSKAVINQRTEIGLGGYGIYMTASEVYSYNFRDICKASMSNTTRGLVHSVTGVVSSAYAKINVDYRRKVVKLECTRNIGALFAPIYRGVSRSRDNLRVAREAVDITSLSKRLGVEGARPLE